MSSSSLALLCEGDLSTLSNSFHISFFVFFFTAHRVLGLSYINYTALQCDLPPLRPRAEI